MLLKILDLFKERKIIGLSDLSIYFKTDKRAIQGMLQQLLRKGYIELLHTECSSCSEDCRNCSFADEKEYYRFIQK